MYIASLLSTGVDDEKGGVDNEKALELDSIFFMQQNILLHSGMTFWFELNFLLP